MDEESADIMAECEKLSDEELVRELKFLADRARHNEVRLIAHMSVFDSRRLCVEEGFRSLYEYCTGTLGFDEGESYRRIRAARVVRAYPQAMKALEKRRVTISALVVLSPWLERDNVGPWLKTAEGKTRRELEALVAARYPQAPMPDVIRHLPERPLIVSSVPAHALEVEQSTLGAPSVQVPEAPPGTAVTGEAKNIIEWPTLGSAAERLAWGWQQLAPISADRVRIGFDAAAVVGSLIERARQILRHKYPEGRLEDLIREALEAYLDRKDPQRRLDMKAAKAEAVAEGNAATHERLPISFLRTWAAGRYIPARVKSAVWQRDDGRCAWREPDGRVCGSKEWLEYDHIRPYAKGGKSEDARNVRLLCRVHNQQSAIAAGFSAGPPAA
jgi:hypothetical protein